MNIEYKYYEILRPYVSSSDCDEVIDKLLNLHSVSVNNFDLKELRSDLVSAHSMIGEIVQGEDEGKNLLDYLIRRLDNGSYSR